MQLIVRLLSAMMAFLLGSQLAVCQASDYSFRHYTTDHGLSSDQTTCVFKDKQGYMWFGTVNGLNRFDGIEFKVYKRAKDGLPGNYIIGINQSPDGGLWISTHLGICRFNSASETFEPLPLPTQTDTRGDNDFVSGLVFDKEGYGWFASAEKLYRLHLQTRRLTTFPGISSDAHPLLMYLFADSQGQLWVMRAGALYRFNPDKALYTYVMGQDTQHPESQIHVASLYEDSQKTVWATTFEKGIMRYDTTKQCFVDEPDENTFVNTMVEDFLPDGKPVFWLGKSQKAAIYRPDSQQQTSFTYHIRDKLSHNGGDVIHLYRDGQTGIIWMATSRGIQKSDPFEIKFKRKLIPLPVDSTSTSEVLALYQNQVNRNLYWIGTTGSGLLEWNRRSNVFKSINGKENTPGRYISDVRQDLKGTLWVASEKGLYSCDPASNQWKHWNNPPATATGYSISTVFPDTKNRIWIGSSQDGVFLLNQETGKIQPWSLNEPLSIGNPLRVNAFEEDSLGRIWVSTSRGLFRIQVAQNRTEKIFLHSLDSQIQPSDRLQSSFKIDSKNRVWVSGIGFLAQADLNGRVNKTYTAENGLQADHVYSLEEDNSGGLWMSTDYLLHRLNLQTGEFTYFRKEHGLFANNADSQLRKDDKGELFIGFTAAFNHLVPEQLLYNKTPPPVVITGIKVDNKPRLPGTEHTLTIDAAENTLSVDFAVLSYHLAEKNQYRYMLEGLDDQWTKTENRNATYTNLAPGTYTFKVKAANSDGIWNEQGAALTIYKIPFFYQTWWFIILMVSVAAGILYGIYRYREANRLRLEAIRNRIATDLHDDMGSTLSSIRIFSDVVQNQIAPVQPEVIPILQRISSSATALSESMQDIIWTIQTKHDSLEDVVTRMREFGLKMAEAKQIDFRMQVSDTFHLTKFHVEHRRNLYLIFKESINNAVKYAQCTKITVDLAVTGKLLRLTIQDNGRGFDPATVRQGNGLQNLRKRAAEIKGQVTVHSAPGEGTKIELHTRITS
ncbi:two-component regulator propeller domain-containing protein [Rhodocytophaga aerolata]